jgi:integrase
MARRSNGEGSIYQTKDGRWRGQVDLGWKDGKRDRRYLSGPTKAAVAKRMREALAKVDAGVPLSRDGRGPSVAEWLDFWLQNISARRVRATSLETQRAHIRNHLVPAFGKVRLRDLTPEHVEAMHTRLYDQGLSGGTVLRVHVTLSRALKVAMQRDLVARNVCQLVDAPTAARPVVTSLDRSQARKVLAAARGARNAARWSVALGLGLRQGEALGLAWPNVDLEAGTLRVSQALARALYGHGCPPERPCGKRPKACPQAVGQPLRLEPPKSRAGERVVRLPAPLVEALRAHRVEQAKERLAAGSKWWTGPEDDPAGSWDLVFRSELGKPLQPKRDYEDWRALLATAGVPVVRLHDARHTAASLLLEMKVQPRVVMEVLGHSTIRLTLDTYSHVMPELEESAARQMSEALWGEPDPVPARRRKRS